MLIMKFGGTSVKDADAMRKVIGIVSLYKSQKQLIVLSACAGITDKLLELISNAPKNSKSKSSCIIDEIESHHKNIIFKLIHNNEFKKEASMKINTYIEELRRLVDAVKLLKECTKRNTAQALAYGELLSTTIFYFACLSKKMKVNFLDAREYIKTDSEYLNANIDLVSMKKSASKLRRKIKDFDFTITQGFISSNSKGITTTLGRGGSDFSAALLGAALNFEEIQIWTDVSGVLTSDPRLVKSARTIPEISFNEMRELAFYGAKVLHPDTIIPAVEKNIPVRILNTYKPKVQGTVIVNKLKNETGKLHSVILKQNCAECIIDIPANMNSQMFFSEKLKQFSMNSINILYSVSTEGNCRIIFDNYNVTKEKIKNILKSENFHIKKSSLLCVAGYNILSKKTGNTLVGENNVLRNFLKEISLLNPVQIILGASPVSVLILTSPEDGLLTLKKIHSYILKNI